MSKKILIITSVVLGLLILFFAGYYIFLKTTAPAGGNSAQSGFNGFFPFGGNSETGTSTTQTIPEEATSTPYRDLTKKLVELWSTPVAGAAIFDSPSDVVVRLMEKSTGHVYDLDLISSAQNRVSNATIPGAYSAWWGTGEASFISQYLADDNDTIQTYYLNIKSTTTPDQSGQATPNQTPGVSNLTPYDSISAGLLPVGIADVSIFNTSMFYIQKTIGGGAVGIVSNLDGSKAKQIWSSPISEFTGQFVNTKTVALTTKPEQGIGGYLYFVDTGTGRVKKILGNIAGMSTLASPDGVDVLVGTEGSETQLYDYNISNGSAVSILPATFPEKCVWSKKDQNTVFCAAPTISPDGASLTSWYKGLTSFSDRIWRYDIKTGVSSIVEDIYSDSGEQIDAINLSLDQNEQYLMFQNKKNGSLWSVNLTK